MFVKSLRLDGFKSFADPIVLEFQPGVNVIVGPNGSGKSNIADSLAWVLGSQAPSSLRGASMEDVIFAGSSTRPRLGMAEVILTLDNSSGVLPLDLAEVTVSRSTDRAGTSEYRINGAPCRLLDVMELLSDTGMGRSLHTVVGQGQLDAVLQARAEERRGFIEEAAQIGKFRRRKDRALKKLERVEDNLLRLNDVVVELGRAIRPLKRQAKAASLYSELMTEQRELKQRLASTELHRLERARTELDPEIDDRKTRLLSDELAHVRATLETVAREREHLTVEAEKAQEIVHGIGRSSDRLAGLARLARERAALIGSRLASETEEGYRERIRLLETDRERWEKESASLRAVADVARDRAESSRRRVMESRAALEEADTRLRASRTRETEADQALVRAEGGEAAGRATVGSLEARVQAVVERRDVARRELEGALVGVDTAQREVAALEEQLDGATEHAAEAEAALEAARERAEDLKQRLNVTHSERAAAQARLDALEDATTAVSDIPGTAERLSPLVADARARADAAGVGEREAERIVGGAEAGVEERWIEVGKHDEELRRLDALMSGAAERVAAGRRQHEAREVEVAALDEELARVRDALATAERAAAEERAVIPERRGALEQTRSDREDSERTVAEARSALDAATQSSSEAEVEARAADERALAAQLRVEEAVAGIADAQAALEGLEDRRARLLAARARVEEVAELASYAASVAQGWAEEGHGRAANVRAAAHEADRRSESLRERERELEVSLESLTRKRNEAEVRRAETRARLEAVGERAMEEWGLSIQDILGLDIFSEDEEPEARQRAEKLDREMRRMGPVNPRAAEEYEELAERERFLNEQIEDLNSSRRDLMRIVRDVDATMIEVFGQAFDEVAREFEDVFQRLFPGGQGSLRLTDPDDLLASGIEIEARPPGKNVRKLSLLSGGERSLVALAFLFSIFRARPSPFYLLDEVEAALDDVNLNRFLVLIAELEEHAQVMIVTHQKRTMEAADVLYGVSMAKDGVSRVVAKRMEEIVL